MSAHTDQLQRCRQCGDEFVLTAGEQELYALRGAAERRPTTCPTCRRPRRPRQGTYTR
jgi:hypothetical protein